MIYILLSENVYTFQKAKYHITIFYKTDAKTCDKVLRLNSKWK